MYLEHQTDFSQDHFGKQDILAALEIELFNVQEIQRIDPHERTQTQCEAKIDELERLIRLFSK
jgi:hypothetical protein